MKVEEQNERSRITNGIPDSDRPRGRSWWIVLLAVVVVALLVVFTILPRIQARNTLARETQEMAIPSVSVVHPRHTGPVQEVVLPANVQAYIDAPIYARTNGYLQHWYVDIGARVRSGQLLAEIDTPEVNQQLRQALADLATAQANVHLAQIDRKSVV